MASCEHCGQTLVEPGDPMRSDDRHRRLEEVLCPEWRRRVYERIPAERMIYP